MLSPLAHPAHRHLFPAQAPSLLGTGIATVALYLRDGEEGQEGQEERGASG
jgi:hypothetical protein